MEMHFPVPQKKKKRGPTHERFSSLFPIPILAADRQKPSFCPYFIGKLEGNHVVVKHSGDAYYLYKMGCFGKGTLSRSLPEYERSQKFIDVPKDDKILPLKVMNSNKYICHLKWREAENEEVDMEKLDTHDSQQKAERDKCNMNNSSASDIDKQTSDPEEKNFTKKHLSKFDDSKPNLFVVNGKEPESQCFPNQVQWLPALKRDPYPINEHLLLTYEEAFFLSYGLGYLLVEDSLGKAMNLEEMWKTFCQRRKKFVPIYIAYHYYRSCGWVPKPGLKFGTDLILYKEGNSFYHATYSVNVQMVESTFLNEDPYHLMAKSDWVTLSGLDRMNEHVAKQLLFCYVIKPTALTEDLLSPKCISSFSVQEMIVSRWVSSQNREKKCNQFPEEFP